MITHMVMAVRKNKPPREQVAGQWVSNIAGQHGATTTNNVIIPMAVGDQLEIPWSVSSEANYDWLTITINSPQGNGLQVVRQSGTNNGTYVFTCTMAGNVTVVMQYSKDGSVNAGSDRGMVGPITRVNK